jgi:O-methyltransferase
MKNIIKKIIKWSIATNLLSFPRKYVSQIVSFAIESNGGVIIYYNDPERRRIIELIRQIKRERPMLLSDNEAFQIFMAVRKTEHISGDMAEVGVYRGGSAKLICEANRDRILHLFDTFQGLPKVSDIDKPQFCDGQFAASFEEVKNSLKAYKNVYLHVGLFPDTAVPVEKENFSFVHLDVDTYESTTKCLEFFYPRMSKGGVILSHDYITATGVRKAFDEFFQDKLEPVIEIPGSQCLITKI